MEGRRISFRNTAGILGTLLLIRMIGLILPYAHSEEERWKLAGRSRKATLWYIDTESISYPSKDVVSVWDYKYTEGLWELDCARSMFRLLYFCVYSKENKIITSTLTLMQSGHL